MKTNAAIAGRLVVAEQIGRPVVGGHQEIKVAVPVEISVSESSPNFGLGEFPSGVEGRIRKCSLPAVQKKVWWLRIANSTTNIADRLVDMAVGNNQIERAVQIDIEEQTSKSQPVPCGRAHAGFRRYIFIVPAAIPPV